MKVILSLVFLNFCVAYAAPITLSPTQDTYTSERDGGGPFGSLEYFRVKNETEATNIRHGFVEFDSTGIGTVSGVTLHLSPEDSGLGSTPTGLAEFEVFGIDSDTTTWSEGTLDYTNDAALITAGTSLGTFNVTDTGAGTPVNFSSVALLNFVNANPGKITFHILRNSFSGGSYVHQFTSSDAVSGGPSLVVIPETSSVAMLMIGFSVLVMIRKR